MQLLGPIVARADEGLTDERIQMEKDCGAWRGATVAGGSGALRAGTAHLGLVALCFRKSYLPARMEKERESTSYFYLSLPKEVQRDF